MARQSADTADSSDSLRASLAERMGRPQRHRLLQGYPSMPQMQFSVPQPVAGSPAGRGTEGVRTLRGALQTGRGGQSVPLADPREPPFVEIDRDRDLIVGIIPHSQCTPRVEGCGFCTFPHDKANKHLRAATIEAVAEEMFQIIDGEPAVAGRRVHALYFGGGTANLAKPEQIGGLFAALAKRASLDGAEVTLEGVPALFSSWFHAPLKMLADLPVRQRRISMGIQTFDDKTTEAMGRSGFGDERSVRKLVARCQAMNLTTSGDFLFNLPEQPLSAMLDDVDRAMDSGLDQICLYNLVLYEGLGTLWSQDPARVAAMPDNEAACANWLALRERLLSSGFVQTTLTNFERAEVVASDRAFVYERASFSPEKTDGLGFGPMSLSLFVDPAARRAVKHLRRKNLRDRPWSGDDLFFSYEADDLRLLFVTRSLAKGGFDKDSYAGFCGSTIDEDFPGALGVLEASGLLENNKHRVELSPRGMFFSDAVVSIFVAEKERPRDGAGIHTGVALASPTQVRDYGGMG